MGRRPAKRKLESGVTEIPHPTAVAEIQPKGISAEELFLELRDKANLLKKLCSKGGRNYFEDLVAILGIHRENVATKNSLKSPGKGQ